MQKQKIEQTINEMQKIIQEQEIEIQTLEKDLREVKMIITRHFESETDIPYITVVYPYGSALVKYLPSQPDINYCQDSDLIWHSS